MRSVYYVAGLCVCYVFAFACMFVCLVMCFLCGICVFYAFAFVCMFGDAFYVESMRGEETRRDQVHYCESDAAMLLQNCSPHRSSGLGIKLTRFVARFWFICTFSM